MSKRPPMPTSPEELAPAAQALAVVDAEIRALAERALRRALEIAVRDSCPVERTTPEEYLPIRDGAALCGVELDGWIHRANDDAALRMVGRGIAYLLKQKELQIAGVSLAAWVEEQGLKRQRVFEDKAVAVMYGTLPEGVVRMSGLLDPQKQVLLASLPPAILERMAIDGTLELMGEMTHREARVVITQRKTLEKKLDQAHNRLQELEQESRDLKALDGWKGDLPQAVKQARVEGSALTLEALDCLTRLDAFAQTLSRGIGLHAESDRRQAELRAGLGPLAAQLLAIRTQADAALQALQGTMGDYIPALQPLLSEGEALAARERFSFMLGSLGRQPLEARASASAKGGARK